MSSSENLRSEVEDIKQQVERNSAVGLEYLDQLRGWVLDEDHHVRYASMDIYIKLAADHPFQIQNHISAIISRLDDEDLNARGAALTATYNLARWYPHRLGTTTELLHRLITDSEVDDEKTLAVGILARLALLRPDLVTPRVAIRESLRAFIQRDDAEEILEDSLVVVEYVEEAIEVLEGGDMASRRLEEDLAPMPRKSSISKPALMTFKWFHRGLILPVISLLWFINLFRWTWRYDHLDPGGRMKVMVDESLKLKFFKNARQRTLYLRSSMWPTTGQVFRFLPGRTPVAENIYQETPPLPDDWGQRATLIRQRDGYRCRNCGAGGGPNGDAELHVDHCIPRSADGSDEPRNLRTLCRSCHEARHARVFKE